MHAIKRALILTLVLATGTLPVCAQAPGESNKALRTGPAPELEFNEGEADVLVRGARLFLDGTFEALELPPALRGRKFVRFSSVLGRAVCRESGVIYVLAPAAGALSKALLKQGFEPADLPPFRLFDGNEKVSTVATFQKLLAKDEAIALGRIGLGARGEFGILIAAGETAKLSARRASALAADPDRYPLWEVSSPFPDWQYLPDLDVVTHVQLERAQRGGFHYLHETAIAWHDGYLYAGWANHGLLEVNVTDERIRGRRSRDGGLTWEPAIDWATPPLEGAESFNHPVLCSHQGALWGFFTRWNNKQPGVQIFTLAAGTQTWRPHQAFIPGFIPMTPPQKLRDGNWILGGELHFSTAAVAISRGDDFDRWAIVKIPHPAKLRLHFPETTLLDFGDSIVAICRPREVFTAPVAVSRDGGRTWSELRLSNFPLFDSKPLGGQLSTGQKFLITNHLEQERTLLTIAVTAPGARTFSRIWKIRHQQTPMRRLLGNRTPTGFASAGKPTSIGTPTEWSYPSAIEHDGKLYVTYTQGKEDGALSIIPLSALAVR